MKAIETEYKGYRFRSRLEARWAVFFDKLGLKWEYEPEGLELPTGEWYLPDFYIELWECYIEIKPRIPWEYFSGDMMLIAGPEAPEKNELLNAAIINAEYSKDKQKMHQHCWVFYGTPGVPVVNKDGDKWVHADGAIGICPRMIDGYLMMALEAFAMVDGGRELDIWPLYLPTKEKHWYIDPTLPTGFMPRFYCGRGIHYGHPNLKKAYSAARSARFEHGEHGGTY